MEKELSLDQKITNFKRLTKVLLDLPESFRQENGWNRRDLLLHLWTWDVEYIRLCTAKLDGKLDDFQYEFERLDMSYSNWNDFIMEKYSQLTYIDILEKFQEARKQLIKLFKKLAEKPEVDVPREYFKTRKILDLWYHDRNHLLEGGVAIHLIE